MQDIDIRLKQIADNLLLNASFTDSPGLLNGKMGIAIFFYHYARCSDNRIYEEFAGELLDQVYEEINTTTLADFENGLTGIGWGIEYLVRYEFVDADTDEALAEVDNSLYRRRLHSPILIDNSNSIFGYGLYYLSRLTGHPVDDNDLNTLIKKYHLIFLIDECERILLQKSYLKFYKDPLSLDCLNSFLAFVLEVHRLNIYPFKSGKLLRILPDIIMESLKPGDKAGIKHTKNLLGLNSGLENIQSSEFEDIFNGFKSDIKDLSKTDVDMEMAIKDIWHKLIYGSVFTGKVVQEDNAFGLEAFLKNEDEMNKIFNKVNKNNLGLEGLAGVGMFILQGEESERHNLQYESWLEEWFVPRAPIQGGERGG